MGATGEVSDLWVPLPPSATGNGKILWSLTGGYEDHSFELKIISKLHSESFFWTQAYLSGSSLHETPPALSLVFSCKRTFVEPCTPNTNRRNLLQDFHYTIDCNDPRKSPANSIPIPQDIPQSLSSWGTQTKGKLLKISATLFECQGISANDCSLLLIHVSCCTNKIS